MDAVDATGKAVPFAITFYTADVQKRTGGERIKIDQRIVTKYRQLSAASTGTNDLKSGTKNVDPNHGLHFTRNLVIPGWEHMVKVHPRLITHFNDMRVVW